MMAISHTRPLLYSFRRCPYAIRARLALVASGIDYDHCEVSLKNKPQAMLDVSAKGTVPVLVLSDTKVLDESLDIMLWALQKNDPHHWLRNNDSGDELEQIMNLIHRNDGEFKYWLDRYKYSDRFPENTEGFYRGKAEEFIAYLDKRLEKQGYLVGDKESLADKAISPFIRQFAHVDRDWFFSTSYTNVIQWLRHFLESDLFIQVMKKSLKTPN